MVALELPRESTRIKRRLILSLVELARQHQNFRNYTTAERTPKIGNGTISHVSSMTRIIAS
jgi:hypothetical protein